MSDQNDMHEPDETELQRGVRVVDLLREEFHDCFDAASKKYVITSFADQEIESDSLNKLKHAVKLKLTRFYPLLVHMISPVLSSGSIRRFLRTHPADQFVTANLGCGTQQFKDVIAVDGSPFPNVHVVCDLAQLPFKNEVLDSVISIAVLEHVPNPQQHVSEFRRVLKPGGRVICFIPFLQPFHASPYDYQRYTSSGMKVLFEEFEVESIQPGAGPTSALLWVLQEWLAMFFSFGSRRLYRILVPMTWILSPLKLLDLVMIRHPMADVAASGFVIIARKRAHED